MRCVTLCASLLVLAVASPAVAQKAHFGGGGQIVLDGVIDVDYEIRRPPRGDSTATTGVTLAPGILYLVADNIAVGGSVTGSTSSDAYKVADFGVRSVIGGWF